MTAVRVPDALAPVGLEELTARAGLLVRTDRKYVLDLTALGRLWTRLPADTRVLEIDGARSFGYTSTYLDTPDLRAFLASAQRRRHRWKVRTRTYDGGATYLEVKTRDRATTVKERIAWPGGTCLDSIAEGFVSATLAASGARVDPRLLRPVLRTRYRRSTLLLAGGGRATIDTNLDWEAVAEGRRLRRPGLVVVETKTLGVASPLDRILWRLGHRQVSVSKYATGLAALNPALPRNRWHRLLSADPFDAHRP